MRFVADPRCLVGVEVGQSSSLLSELPASLDAVVEREQDKGINRITRLTSS